MRETNKRNFYKLYMITKYDFLADLRESRLGILWKFLHPAIQILTYWFLFSFVLNKREVDGIPYVLWMLVGMCVWFFISPGITDGCNAIYKKRNVVSKMKFPLWILPLAVILQKLIDHLFVLVITVLVLLAAGFHPSIRWFNLLYYMICAVLFCFAVSLVTSVFQVIARDTRKLILACMRLYLYVTPVLWDVSYLDNERWRNLIMANPVYYIVSGYRACFFYEEEVFGSFWSAAWFWGLTLTFFLIGKMVMSRFQMRFTEWM